MWPLVVVQRPKAIEGALLRGEIGPRGPTGPGFERPVHAFVGPILLGRGGMNALMLNAEAHPPDVELRQAMDATRREGDAVVGAHRARTITTVQPSTFIFTKSHYSMLFLQTDQPRPGVPAPQTRQNLTDAEKLARFEHWRPFTASAGTYQVSGTTVTLRPIIAKDGWAMSEQAVQSMPFQLVGSDTLLTHFAPAIGIRVKLVRVE